MNDTFQSSILIIPAYQPSHILVDLVSEILASPEKRLFAQIIVINDGSLGDAKKIFIQLQEFQLVTVLHHATNLGKGAALKTGFNHALISYPNCKTIITADADGQHSVKDIISVTKKSTENVRALVLGCRRFTGKVPARSLFGNKLTRAVVHFFTGLKVSDSQTGLRAWPALLAKSALKTAINGYDFEMETLVRAKHMVDNLEIHEVAIDTIYIENNKSSHFNPLKDSMRIYFVFIRYCASGFLTALTDNIIFVFTYLATNNIITSQVIGRSFGAAVSFTLNFKLVFKSSAKFSQSLVKFLMLVVLLGIVSYGMIRFFSQELRMNVFVSKLLSELILFVSSFVIQRSLVFTGTNEGDGKLEDN